MWAGPGLPSRRRWGTPGEQPNNTRGRGMGDVNAASCDGVDGVRPALSRGCFCCWVCFVVVGVGVGAGVGAHAFCRGLWQATAERATQVTADGPGRCAATSSRWAVDVSGHSYSARACAVHQRTCSRASPHCDLQQHTGQGHVEHRVVCAWRRDQRGRLQARRRTVHPECAGLTTSSRRCWPAQARQQKGA